MAAGGGGGGATILDLHSGALSMGDSFVDAYQLPAASENGALGAELELYGAVKRRIAGMVERELGVEGLLLTKPTFFSRLDARAARTEHDEYWHEHVDTEQYGSFEYTCLLYLATHGDEFTGGEFEFTGRAPMLVQPRIGRVSCFTSGPENPHRVRRVASGTRYAITVAFTCDEAEAIAEPTRIK